MGMITIKVEGSFDTGSKLQTPKYISAVNYGHAAAVSEAIGWLSSYLLPRAIKLDHDLHEKGEKPGRGFGLENL